MGTFCQRKLSFYQTVVQSILLLFICILNQILQTQSYQQDKNLNGYQIAALYKINRGQIRHKIKMSISASDFFAFSLPLYIQKYLHEALSYPTTQLIATVIDLNNSIYPEIAKKISKKLYYEAIKKNLLQMKAILNANKNTKKTIMKKQQIEKLLCINFLELYCLKQINQQNLTVQQRKVKDEILLTQSSIKDENCQNCFHQYEFMILLNDYKLLCQFQEVGTFKQNIQGLLSLLKKLHPTQSFSRKIREIFIKADINIKIALKKQTNLKVQQNIQNSNQSSNRLSTPISTQKQNCAFYFSSSAKLQEENFKTPEKLRQTNQTQSGCKPTELASKQYVPDQDSGLKSKSLQAQQLCFPLTFSKVATYNGRTIYSSHPMRFVKKPSQKQRKKKKYIFTDSIDL